ncbi:hypothetical protein E4U11_005989 [Claviceps purpurea]|nr:hypothetical protein E4U11_005989 [Claviceps purpurea]
MSPKAHTQNVDVEKLRRVGNNRRVRGSRVWALTDYYLQQNRRPPKIGQDNAAPPPVRRARRSRAQINAGRAAEERKRMANVEEAMAAAEANARRIREQAEAASVAGAEVEGASRAAADARKASRAAEDARRDATLRESMAAAARVNEANARQFREQAEAAWAASAAEYARRDAALREPMAATAVASQETSRAAVLHESLERRRSLPHSYPAGRGKTPAFGQLDIPQPGESDYSSLGNASEMSLGPSAAAADESIACNPFVEIWGTRRQVLFSVPVDNGMYEALHYLMLSARREGYDVELFLRAGIGKTPAEGALCSPRLPKLFSPDPASSCSRSPKATV